MNTGTPRALFLAVLQNMGRRKITWDDVTIDRVTPANGPNGTNTIVDIKANTNGNYLGTRSVRIIRTDVASLFQDIEVVLDPKDFYNIVELLPDLARLYGLQLEHTDVVNASLPKELPAKITIQMHPNNLALYGALTLSLQATGKDLGSIITSDIVDAPLIFSTPNMIEGALLYRRFDFSASKAQLEALRTGTLHAYDIQQILGRYVETPWTIAPTHERFNLYECVVVAARESDVLDKVVRVKLNEKYCSNVTGSLELHFRT